MDLTPEETALLMQMTHGERGGRRLAFYAVILMPIIAFGVAGLWKQDFAALAVALLGAVAYLLWHMASEWHYARLFRSIARKALAAAGGEARA